MRFPHLTAALLLGVGVVMAATPVSALPVPAEFSAHVTVTTVLTQGGAKERFQVHCPSSSAVACRALRLHPEVLWPEVGRQCSQQYAGPEWARIRGVVNGRKVDLTIARNNGCGIADWRALKGLLP